MAEVQAVKDLDKVKLISHLLERRYSKQMADIWNIGLNLVHITIHADHLITSDPITE